MATRRDAWWKYARAFQQMPENSRRADVPNHQVRAHLARIARLPPSIGEALDKQKAPMRVYRYIAYAPGSAAVPHQLGQKARAEVMMAFAARTGRWPLPRQMREIDQAVRARWSGMGPARASRRTPQPPQTAPAAPQTAPPQATTARSATTQTAPAPVQVPLAAAPRSATTRPAAAPVPLAAAPRSAAPTHSAVDAVARQNPQLAAVLLELAANRTKLGP